jgi:hypothetical protein
MKNKSDNYSLCQIKSKLIEAGVRNLQEFGYPKCSKDNILTDMIYSRFFLSMLKDQCEVGKVGEAVNVLIEQLENKKNRQ